VQVSVQVKCEGGTEGMCEVVYVLQAGVQVGRGGECVLQQGG
jgi:hypothetical protein